VANNRITTNICTTTMTMEQWHKNIHMTKLTKKEGHRSNISYIINRVQNYDKTTALNVKYGLPSGDINISANQFCC